MSDRFEMLRHSISKDHRETGDFYIMFIQTRGQTHSMSTCEKIQSACIKAGQKQFVIALAGYSSQTPWLRKDFNGGVRFTWVYFHDREAAWW